MFSGIVEEYATVVALVKDQENIHFTLKCSFVNELKIDQSISHNGVCLTVVSMTEDTYTVTAMKETLDRSNLRLLKVGDKVALEPGKTCGHCEHCKEGKYNLCEDVIFFATPPVDGVFQEYVAHEAGLCFKIPENMSTMEAALIEPLAVGMHAANQGGAHLGQTAVVTEDIDNLAAHGRVEVLGNDWAARSTENVRIQKGTKVQVVRIEGVKLIVTPTVS